MAHTKVTKTGTQNNGTPNTFSYSGSFDVFKAAEVEVELDNVALTFTTSTINESASPREYTVDYNNKTVHVGGANLASSNSVVILPVTDLGKLTNEEPKAKATYQPGSSVTSADLNNNQLQLMRKALEYDEQKLSSRGGTMTGNLHLGKNVDISFEGDTDNAHEITLTAADPTSDKTITFPDTTGTVVTTGDTGTVARGMIANDAINGDKIDNDAINSEHYAAGSIDLEHMSANSVDSDQYVNGSIDNEHYAAGSITSDKLSDATVITSSEQASASSNDTSFLTSAAADARFFNVSTTDTIKDGQAFPDNDTSIATTAAINDRIIDLVDDVGGFVPIANETSFPTANPDVNNGAGTLVSIKEISSTRTPSTGTVTIANGSGSNTVTITGCGSTVLTAGFGVIVETTSTLHTYAFHRLVPKATEVSTVAGSISNVNTVAGIDGNVTTVAGISSDVTTVAGISSNVTTVANDATDIGAVAGKATEIGRLGTADAVADLAILGTTDVVADMNTLATSANVTAMDNCSDDIANINTVSGSISNVNTVATNVTAVTNASTYLNNFLSLYLGELASDPTQDALGNSINEGDLYWNNVTKLLRVYNGSVWQGVNDNSVELLKVATGGFELVYTASAGSNNIDLGALAISGAHFSNESLPTNKMSLAKGSATYNLGGI